MILTCQRQEHVRSVERNSPAMDRQAPACLTALAVGMKSDDSEVLHLTESESAKCETQTRTIRYFDDYELLEEIAH